MPRRIPPETKAEYRRLRVKVGHTRADACRMTGVSEGWAKAFDKGLRNSSGREWSALHEAEVLEKGPIPLDQLGPDAIRAMGDIGFFAYRYFGLMLMPFQEEAAALAVELQATDEEEYLVINVAPGTGKSTFFTLVLPAWITVRQRHIRGMIGSVGLNLAKM